MLIWLTYFEINLNKLWEKNKLFQLSTTAMSDKILKRKIFFSGDCEILSTKKISSEKSIKILRSSDFERVIPEEFNALSVFDKYLNYNKDTKTEEKQVTIEEKQVTITENMRSSMGNKKKFSMKQSVLKIELPKNETNMRKMKVWYKIRHYYNNYNLYLKMNSILQSEGFFELISLGIMLLSYNLLATVNSLIYLIVIGILCFCKHHSKIVFFKNFCLIFFNIKYLCFFYSFQHMLPPQIVSEKFSSNNLMSFLGKKQELPSSYFSVEFSEQEFWAFFLLFVILFTLQVYIILHLKMAKYISKQLQRTFENFNNNYMEDVKMLDYNVWEQKSQRFFIDLQEIFFEYFDRAMILSIGFFAIFYYYFFNMVIFFLSILYIFMIEFQIKWDFLDSLQFKSKFYKFLNYFSFLALLFNHILLIPQVSEGCSHFICMEIGSKSDKLYNVFILQCLLTFIRLKFYKDYPKYSKMQALRVKFLLILNKIY